MEQTEQRRNVAPDEGYGYIAGQYFRAETFDIEVTRLFCLGETNFQWSGGVRYGELNQAALLTVVRQAAACMPVGLRRPSASTVRASPRR